MPIVILTARSDEIDRIVGFELGVNDYICKPFSPREVVARIKAILRRSGTPAAQVRPILQFGRLEIDERAREVRVDGTDVQLKPREFALLLELASNPGVALSRERICRRCGVSTSAATSEPSTCTFGGYARRSRSVGSCRLSSERSMGSATSSYVVETLDRRMSQSCSRRSGTSCARR